MNEALYRAGLDEHESVVESLVDRVGLDGLLSLLADVSREKAAHVEETWQDRVLARQWRQAARILTKAQDRVGTLGLSD